MLAKVTIDISIHHTHFYFAFESDYILIFILRYLRFHQAEIFLGCEPCLFVSVCVAAYAIN